MNALFELGAYLLAMVLSAGSLVTMVAWMLRELAVDARGFPREPEPPAPSGERDRDGMIATRARRRLPVTS